MADGTQPVRPRLFEADLLKDPRKPIRHPFDAVPYTRPENVLDEPGMLRAVRAAPGHCLYWPANTVNRRLSDRMVEHGWLQVNEIGMVEPTDDGWNALDNLNRGHAAPDWNRPIGALF